MQASVPITKDFPHTQKFDIGFYLHIPLATFLHEKKWGIGRIFVKWGWKGIKDVKFFENSE